MVLLKLELQGLSLVLTLESVHVRCVCPVVGTRHRHVYDSRESWVCVPCILGKTTLLVPHLGVGILVAALICVYVLGLCLLCSSYTLGSRRLPLPDISSAPLAWVLLPRLDMLLQVEYAIA